MEKKLIHQRYVIEQKSLRVIAKEFGCSVSKLYRFLIDNHIPLRDKSQAQKNHLKVNKHPRQGTKLSRSTKDKISQGLGNFWDNLSSSEKNKRIQAISDNWHNMWKNYSLAEKQSIIDRLVTSQKPGRSQLEDKVAKALRDEGLVVETRTKNYTPNREFHVDIAIPKNKLIIEIDGPMHFLPIFGADKLQKSVDRDARKDKILTSSGYTVLRIRDLGSRSQIKIKKIVTYIQSLISQNPSQQVFYLEV